MTYCNQDKMKDCSEARKSVKEANGGKLPKKYEGTALESCRYCGSFMDFGGCY